MKIDLFELKTNAKVECFDDEFIIEENFVYRAICTEGEFNTNERKKGVQYVTNQAALISFTNKVGHIEIENIKFRIRSKLGDDFFDKIKLKIYEIEKYLLISENGISDSLALSQGQYFEDIALSLFLESWKKGNTKKSLRVIFNDPNVGFVDLPRNKDLTKGAVIDELDFQYLTNTNSSLIKFNDKNLPKVFTSPCRLQTHNIVEMKFVKFFLFFCINLLRRRIGRLTKIIEVIDEKINNLKAKHTEGITNDINKLELERTGVYENINEVRNIKLKLNSFIKNPVLKNVKPSHNFDFTSLKIHNNFHLKGLLNLYLRMRRSFEAFSSNDSVYLDMDSFEHLYEYYCLIKLLEDFEVSKESIRSLITKDNFGWIIDKSKPISLGKYKEKNLTLYFKKSFSKGIGSFSQRYDPDYTIAFWQPGTKPQYFHLDAKYKTYNGVAKKEDIDKMHTYTHAIKYTLGSVVLFPGSRNELYKCNDSVVGALYCTPLASENIKSELFSNYFPLLELQS